MGLTELEWDVLHQLSLRPHGAPIRGDDLKAAVIGLALKGLVCDPHPMGNALFTRITDAGRLALQHKDTNT